MFFLLQTLLKDLPFRGIVRIFRLFEAVSDIKRLGLRCITCQFSTCIHCRNVRAAIEQESVHVLMKHLPMTDSKITESHAQAAFKLDAARLSLKVPIARHFFPIPGTQRLSQQMKDAIKMRESYGLLASVGKTPEPCMAIGKCECPLVPRIGRDACFCGNGTCNCVQAKSWEECVLVSEGRQVANTA